MDTSFYVNIYVCLTGERKGMVISLNKKKLCVAEHNDGMKVSNLYIAQVKRKCGVELAENLRVATRRMDCSQDNSTTAASDLELVPSHNLPKSEESRQPQCPKEKAEAIMEALRHYRMI